MITFAFLTLVFIYMIETISLQFSTFASFSNEPCCTNVSTMRLISLSIYEWVKLNVLFSKGYEYTIQDSLVYTSSLCLFERVKREHFYLNMFFHMLSVIHFIFTIESELLCDFVLGFKTRFLCNVFMQSYIIC